MDREAGIIVKKTGGQGGFTLLEILVAITVTAVIVTLVGGAMRLGHRSILKGERSMERIERMRVSLNLIDSQIQSLFRFENDSVGEGGEPGDGGFRGEESELSFYTNYSIWTGRRGCVSVSYRVVADERGKMSLYAVEDRAVAGLDGAAPDDLETANRSGNETLMLDGMEEIYFEYPSGEEGVWSSAWEGGGVPDKIRVNLRDGQSEVHLLVPARAGGI